METNIIVAGVGGQGSILASHIIAEAAILEHGGRYHARVGETFGAAQRGGAVASHVRIGEEVYGPLLGQGTADLILALEPLEALRLGVPYLAAEGVAVINTTQQVPVDVKVGAADYPELSAITEALSEIGGRVVTLDGAALAEEAGSPKVLSVVMLGAAFASGLLPFSEETVLAAIKARVPQKTIDINLAAFALGKEAYQKGAA